MKKYSHHTIDIARELRKCSTPAEKLLWQRVRNRQLGQLRFVRQHPIGRYIADFYCHERRLVIELEGSAHDRSEQKSYDEVRFRELDARGLRVLRIKNGEVIRDMESVLKKILSVAREICN